MASAELSRRVGEVVGYPPLCGMSDLQRPEFHEGLLDADALEDLPGKWQAAILLADDAPNLRIVGADQLPGAPHARPPTERAAPCIESSDLDRVDRPL